jgi:hypothetical protein
MNSWNRRDSTWSFVELLNIKEIRDVLTPPLCIYDRKHERCVRGQDCASDIRRKTLFMLYAVGRNGFGFQSTR